MPTFTTVQHDWSDDPVYVIGGGPSLRGFDFSCLDGVLLGCNKAAWAVDTPFMVSLDQHFVRVFRDRIADYVREGGTAYLAVAPNNNDHKPIENAHYLYRTRNNGLSHDPSRLYGVHTGYAALNLAFLAGAKQIGLLGLDMQYDNDGRSHHHEGYEWQNKESPRYYDKWSRNFERAAVELREAGVEVINFIGEPRSKITEFPTRPLDELQ